MLAFIRSLGAAVQATLAFVAGIGLATAALMLWDGLVDDPSVRREALRGYVAKVELEAANAKAAEIARQRDAFRRSAEAYQSIVEQARKGEAAAREQLEQRIADYEQDLARRDRACRLDDADVDWLRKP